MARQTAAVGSPFYAILSYPNDSPPDLQVWYRSAWAKNPVLLAKVPQGTLPQSVMIQRQGQPVQRRSVCGWHELHADPGQHGQRGPADHDHAGDRRRLRIVQQVRHGLVQQYLGCCAGHHHDGRTRRRLTRARPAGRAPTSATPARRGTRPGPGSSLTLAGTGTGFGGSSDSVHYVYQSVSGNESISAQVAPSPARPAKTQDGLMMRASASPTAPMYSVYLNPGGSATIQWRVNDGIKYAHNIPLTSVDLAGLPEDRPLHRHQRQPAGDLLLHPDLDRREHLDTRARLERGPRLRLRQLPRRAGSHDRAAPGPPPPPPSAT